MCLAGHAIFSSKSLDRTWPATAQHRSPWRSTVSWPDTSWWDPVLVAALFHNFQRFFTFACESFHVYFAQKEVCFFFRLKLCKTIMQREKKKKRRIIISKVYDTFQCSHNDFLHFLVFFCVRSPCPIKQGERRNLWEKTCINPSIF